MHWNYLNESEDICLWTIDFSHEDEVVGDLREGLGFAKYATICAVYAIWNLRKIHGIILYEMTTVQYTVSKWLRVMALNVALGAFFFILLIVFFQRLLFLQSFLLSFRTQQKFKGSVFHVI